MSDINKRIDAMKAALQPGQFFLVSWPDGRYWLNPAGNPDYEHRDLTEAEFLELAQRPGAVVMRVKFDDN